MQVEPLPSHFGVHLVSIVLKSLYGKVQERGSNPLYSIYWHRGGMADTGDLKSSAQRRTGSSPVDAKLLK